MRPVAIRRSTLLVAAGLALVVVVPVRLLTTHAADPPTPDTTDCAVLTWGGGPAALTAAGKPEPVPTPLPGLCGGVTGIAAGGLHSLAVTSDGHVASWGSDDAGQLGDGGTADRSDPRLVRGVGGSGVLSDVGCPSGAPPSCVPIAAGLAHSLALRRDGTVAAWGDNSWGQLGDGTTIERQTPVVVAGLRNVVAIAAGSAHNLALLADGSVMAWGSDSDGQLGDGAARPGANPHVMEVSGLGAGSGVTAVAAGDAHSLALVRGQVLAWGANESGELGDLTTTSRSVPAPVAQLPASVVSVAAGSGYTGFSLALERDGSVYAWGEDSFGQLGDGKPATLYAGRPEPALVSSLGRGSGVTSIAAGGGHGLAVQKGRVVMWGFDSVDEPLVGHVPGHLVPANVGGISGHVVALAAGGSQSIVLRSSGGQGAAGTSPAPSASSAVAVARLATAAGSAPGTDVLATPQDVTGFGAPMMAADPANPGRIALAYRDAHKCWLSLSDDGGTTWRSLTLAGPDGRLAVPRSVSDPSADFSTCGLPTVTYARDGTLYVAFTLSDHVYGNVYDNVFLTATNDDGATFAAAQQVDAYAAAPSSISYGDWRPMLAADNTGSATTDSVYVVWTRFGSDNVAEQLTTCTNAELASLVAGRSMRCGRPTTVSRPGQMDANDRAAIAVGARGAIGVAWTDTTERHSTGDGSGPETVDVAISHDFGRSFSNPETALRVTTVCPDFTCPDWAEPIVSLAAAPNGEFIVAGAGLHDGYARIMLSRSNGGGQAWAATMIVPPAGAHNDAQHTPEVAVAPDGRVDVAYYDERPGGAQNSSILSSNDDGSTFSRPRELSSVGSDEAILLPVSADFRMGLISDNAGDIVAWADTRRGSLDNGKTDIAVASPRCPC